MGLFGFLKKDNEQKPVDSYTHPANATVPKERISINGKQYFRKYYYYGIDIVGRSYSYTFFRDCDPLTPVDKDYAIELYFHDIHAGNLPEKYVQMYRDYVKRGDPVEIQVCSPDDGRISSIRIAFYRAQEDLSLEPITIKCSVTNSNEDEVLHICDVDTGDEIELEYNDETECYEVYANGTILLGRLSEQKSEQIYDAVREGYQIIATLTDVKIKDYEKATSKFTVTLK